MCCQSPSAVTAVSDLQPKLSGNEVKDGEKCVVRRILASHVDRLRGFLAGAMPVRLRLRLFRAIWTKLEGHVIAHNSKRREPVAGKPEK